MPGGSVEKNVGSFDDVCLFSVWTQIWTDSPKTPFVLTGQYNIKAVSVPFQIKLYSSVLGPQLPTATHGGIPNKKKPPKKNIGPPRSSSIPCTSALLARKAARGPGPLTKAVIAKIGKTALELQCDAPTLTGVND